MAQGIVDAGAPEPATLARQPLHWIEIVAKPGQEAALPSRKLLERLRGAGCSVRLETVACPFIWQTFDRESAPALHDTTLRMLEAAP
jgi:hypothetical protein